MMRQEARFRNMTIEEFASYNLAHPVAGIDKMLDQRINILGTHDYVIAEGRLPHIFLPGAFKVYLDCAFSIRASRRAEQISSPLAIVKKDLRKRDSDDNTRYQKLYGPGCLWTPDQFDLVINTGDMDEMEVFQYMLASHEKWKEEAGAPWSVKSMVSDSSCWPAFAINVHNLFVPACSG